MRPSIAPLVLTVQGRPAQYVAPDGSSTSIRARLREIDREIRSNRVADLVAGDAIATVSASVAPRRGGILAFDGTEYEIVGIVRSGVPGLLDLALIRKSGPAIDRRDFSRVVLPIMSEPITIDGRQVRAHVNRSGLVLEEDELGNGVEVLRHSVAISLADADNIRAGSILEIDGRQFVALRVLRDGLGMIRVIC